MFVLRYLKDHYRTDEVARVFAVHPNTVRNWADEGWMLPDMTPTGQRKFPLAELVRRGASMNR